MKCVENVATFLLRGGEFLTQYLFYLPLEYNILDWSGEGRLTVKSKLFYETKCVPQSLFSTKSHRRKPGLGEWGGGGGFGSRF